MWLIGLILFWAVLLLGVSALQRSRGEALVASGTCPSCRIELVSLRAGPTVQPPPAWEVLACPTCSVTTPVVQGVPGRVSWCPECQQRALELTATRLEPDEDAPIRVEIAERCHLCAHADEILVEQRSPGRRGKVIPFPGGRD